MGYARSPFRDFESYVRIVVGLDEVNIQLISKNNTSQILLHLNYHQAFTKLNIFQRLFTPLVIMEELYKLKMMILS